MSMAVNNISTILISAALAAAAVMIIRNLYKNVKEGRCVCGCSGCSLNEGHHSGEGCCEGCPGCGGHCEK